MLVFKALMSYAQVMQRSQGLNQPEIIAFIMTQENLKRFFEYPRIFNRERVRELVRVHGRPFGASGEIAIPSEILDEILDVASGIK